MTPRERIMTALAENVKLEEEFPGYAVTGLPSEKAAVGFG